MSRPLTLMPHRMLGLACLFFLLVKGLWVLLPVQAMGVPRLGDDSLVYLFTGVSTVLDPKMDTPAVQDILALRQMRESNDSALDFLRARTTMRVTYVAASPFAMVTGLLVKAGLSHKAAFAGAELIVAVGLTAALAAIGTALFGPAGGVMALTLLAFAILPMQGLHYLVPGVLALALGLLLLAEICRPRARLPVLLVLAVVLGLTHTIGTVYIALAIAFAALLPVARHRALVVNWRVLATLVLGACAAWAFVRLSGGRAPATSGTGGLSLTGFLTNLRFGLGYVGQSIATQPVTWALGCAGLVLTVRARRIEPLVLLFLLLGLFGAACLFEIPGYPGELAARVLVFVLVFLAAASGVAMVWAYGASRILFAAALVLVAGQTAVQAHATWLLLVDNMNSRAEIEDGPAIRADLAALPDGASILWTDPDISMMAAFIEGGTRFHAVPYPMIERSPERKDILARFRPAYIAAPIPKSFNTTARAGATHFSPRRYGVSFADFRTLQIRLPQQAGERVYLRLSQAPAQHELTLVAGNGGAGCAAKAGELMHQDGKLWLPVALDGCPAGTILTLSSDSPRLALLGLSFGPPQKRVNWPWGSTARVVAEAREEDGLKVALVFDWPTLLGRDLAREAEPVLLSDESGIVWLKTDMAPSLSNPAPASGAR